MVINYSYQLIKKKLKIELKISFVPTSKTVHRSKKQTKNFLL